MKVGIIGLPEVGKTSLFNALTRRHEQTHAYGAHSDTLNIGSVDVPDERFDFAVAVCRPKKQVPASIEFTDGGARVQIDQAREKFGGDFFAGVRNMDALLLVLRAFHSETLPDPPGGLDPVRDVQKLMEELLLADLGVIEARLERLEKSRVAKRLTATDAAEQQLLVRVKEHLERLQPVRTFEFTADEERLVRSFAFVSGKPVILAANVGESDLPGPAEITAGLRHYARTQGLELIEFCASLEMECAQMAPDEEREFLAEMGVTESARDRITRAAYAALGYISFFTVGPDEVRAWTIRRGATALGAAEKIHTEIARTFIRAEVMPFDEFRAHNGWDQAKAAGKMRLEGKEYVVKDGDIVHIRNSKG